MTPTIRVDDEVYALLQERGEAFVDTPNTVLRRILGLTESGESTGNPIGRREGSRERSGEPQARQARRRRPAPPDEELVWERRNNGERHTARVGADGTLVLEDGHVADSPSAAARHLAGYEVNGWRVWRRRRRHRRSPTSGAQGRREGRREGRRHGGGATARRGLTSAHRAPIRQRLTGNSRSAAPTRRCWCLTRLPRACSRTRRTARRARPRPRAGRRPTSRVTPRTTVAGEVAEEVVAEVVGRRGR